MGMDVQMVGDHGLNFKRFNDLIEVIPDRLNFDFSSENLGNYLSELYITDEEKKWNYRWTFNFESYFSSIDEQFKSDNEISFQGPYGHRLRIGKETISIYSPVRWSAFLKNLKIREDLRSFIFNIIKSLEGQSIIYFPDNAANSSEYDQYVNQSMSFDEIKELMQKEVGNSANNLDDILTMKSDRAIYDGYYIDSFEDKR